MRIKSPVGQGLHTTLSTSQAWGRGTLLVLLSVETKLTKKPPRHLAEIGKGHTEEAEGLGWLQAAGPSAGELSWFKATTSRPRRKIHQLFEKHKGYKQMTLTL